MKINLHIDLSLKDRVWNIRSVEKEFELDVIPSVGDEIEDNDLHFKVKSVQFNTLEEKVNIYLKDLEFIDEETKKDALKRMEKSGWYYKDPIVYPLSEL